MIYLVQRRGQGLISILDIDGKMADRVVSAA
jgi:hypothetical protein